MCEGFHVTNEVMYYSLLQHQNNILVLNLNSDSDGIWSHFWPSCFLYHRFTSIHANKYLWCSKNTEKTPHNFNEIDPSVLTGHPEPSPKYTPHSPIVIIKLSHHTQHIIFIVIRSHISEYK